MHFYLFCYFNMYIFRIYLQLFSFSFKVFLMFQYKIKSNISCNLTALRPSQGTTRPWSSTIPLCRHFRGLHADQLGHFARESKTHYRPSIDHLPLCGHHSIRRSIENRRIAEHKRHEVHVGFGWGMQTSRGKIFRNIWALFKIIIVITKFRLAFQSCFHIVLSFEWENAARNSVPSANRSAQNNQGYRMDGRRDCGVHDIQVNGFLKYLFKFLSHNYFFFRVLGNMPNTYAYTKCLSEALVVEQIERGLPAIIFRPSIVVPIRYDPIPGWTDNMNGPTGLLIGAGKGVIRTMYCNSSGYGDFLPVDFAVNGVLIGSWNYITNRYFTFFHAINI